VGGNYTGQPEAFGLALAAPLLLLAIPAKARGVIPVAVLVIPANAGIHFVVAVA
jgi:hypothetical protein